MMSSTSEAGEEATRTVSRPSLISTVSSRWRRSKAWARLLPPVHTRARSSSRQAVIGPIPPAFIQLISPNALGIENTKGAPPSRGGLTVPRWARLSLRAARRHSGGNHDSALRNRSRYDPATTYEVSRDRTPRAFGSVRSEEHTSELQSLRHLVC